MMVSTLHCSFPLATHLYCLDGQRCIMLQAISFVDREVAERALKEEKKQRKKEKKKGKKVGTSRIAFICLGVPLLYGTLILLSRDLGGSSTSAALR